MRKEFCTSVEEIFLHPVFGHFNHICQIPHPSFHEEALSKSIAQWARNLGLQVERDSHNNVFIRKPASPGCEEKPPILFQAHLDMVAEKRPDVDHDFLRDAITVQLDGDRLSTGGRTTLGADNGIGVAIAMAILEAGDLSHPQLEVLFTTAEEEDMSGALQVDPSLIQSRQLINLDNTAENQVIAGSCGGMGVTMHIPVDYRAVPEGMEAVVVKIGGLTGGHSGEDIHRGRGNAIVLLGRLLQQCCEQLDCSISEVSGGNFRLALPREASATIVLLPQQAERLVDILGAFEKAIRVEYATTPTISVTSNKAQLPFRVLADQKGLITALCLAPNGIAEMNGAVNVVASSCNLGELRLSESEIELVFEVRASENSARQAIYNRINTLALLLGGTTQSFAVYPGWSFFAESPLRQLAKDTYQALYGEDMETIVVHCGLECGCLVDKVPGLDAICIGPDSWDLHSPTESVSVSSTIRVYRLLCEMLERLQPFN